MKYCMYACAFILSIAETPALQWSVSEGPATHEKQFRRSTTPQANTPVPMPCDMSRPSASCSDVTRRAPICRAATSRVGNWTPATHALCTLQRWWQAQRPQSSENDGTLYAGVRTNKASVLTGGYADARHTDDILYTIYLHKRLYDELCGLRSPTEAHSR